MLDDILAGSHPPILTWSDLQQAFIVTTMGWFETDFHYFVLDRKFRNLKSKLSRQKDYTCMSEFLVSLKPSLYEKVLMWQPAQTLTTPVKATYIGEFIELQVSKQNAKGNSSNNTAKNHKWQPSESKKRDRSKKAEILRKSKKRRISNLSQNYQKRRKQNLWLKASISTVKSLAILPEKPRKRGQICRNLRFWEK